MKGEGNKFLKFIGSHKVRLALSAFLIALLFVVPILTEAQYVWKLNEFEILRAKALYFDGNYMHDVSRNTSYRTTGWDGTRQPLDGKTVEIRNFENALLTNAQGEDVQYEFTWKIETYKYTGVNIQTGAKTYQKQSAANAYTMQVTPKDMEPVTGNTYYGILVGNGKPLADAFNISINQPTAGIAHLPNESYIIIKLEARNIQYNPVTLEVEDPETYSKKIACSFQFVMGSGSGFVSRFDLEDTVDNTLELTFGTGEATSMTSDSQTITIWWNSAKLSMDPATVLFQKFYNNYEKYYGQGALEGYSCITLTGLASYYTGLLKYFKNEDLTITYGSPAKTVNLEPTDDWFYIDEDEDNFYTGTILVAENCTPTQSWTTDDQAIIGYYIGPKQAQ